MEQGHGRAVQLGIGGAALVVAALYYWEARSYSVGSLARPGTAAFPVLVAAGLAGVGLIIVVGALLHREAPVDVEADEGGGRRVVKLLGVLCGYVAALFLLGFTAASILSVLAMVHVMESKLGTVGRVVYSVTMVLGIETLFTVVFKVGFPGGLIGILT